MRRDGGAVVPGLTDHELPAILKAARRAGASRAGYIVLRLPWGVKELFTDWLERVLPERASKVLARVREMRGGALYDPRIGKRLRGEGVWAEQLAQLFRVCARREGFAKDYPPLSAAAFRRPGQLTLF